MVAIITVEKGFSSHLAEKAAGRPGPDYSEAWRFENWHGRTTQLVIMVDRPSAAIRWLGRAVRGRRVSSRDVRVNVVELHGIEPIEIDRIRQYWPDPRNRLSGGNDGILEDSEAVGFLNALLTVNNELGPLLQLLDRPGTPLLGTGARGELFNQERDALGLILELSGIDRTELERWVPPVEDVPFLTGLSSYVEREDVMVDHDLHRFGDWAGKTARVGWHTFTNGSRRVFVMNANRSPVERTLGVDMVYYNENRNSFVLVQYKKMRPEKVRGGKQSLFYRPDDQLWVEIEQMRRVDKLCGTAEGEYRLNWGASWFKLCDPDPAIEDPTALIKGMYFALDHFEELLGKERGPRGGIRIGYDDVDRYFSNTMFLDLVRDGWIGSRGPASETLKSLVQESLASGRAVMLGLEPRPMS